MLSQFQIHKRLFKRKKRQGVERLYVRSSVAKKIDLVPLSSEERELLRQIKEIKPLIKEFLAFFPSTIYPTPSKLQILKKHTIENVLETMLVKGNNGKDERVRKKNTVILLLKAVGLTLKDDYGRFHNADTIAQIAKYIVEQEDVKGDKKRRQERYIKELAVCGMNIDPENYKANVINNLPKIEKTKKSEKNPHIPYSKDDLSEIFNPKHTHFKENPDAFFICLIALFTGARANSAITLQYDDIIQKDGIWCIHFTENHPIKRLKNEASERMVPIHSQLLDLGFVDYVQNRQTRLEAKGTDFIFPRCQTQSGRYNNKYTTRFIFRFLSKIGIKKASNDSRDFHSFRKNASIAMQDAGISQSYINDIIGWKGKTTMEQSYSNHSLAQIQSALEKFSYGFLACRFARWKKIMKKAE